MFSTDEIPYGTGFNNAPISICTTGLMNTCFETHDKMAYHHKAPAAMTASAPPNQNAARAQRSNQVQFIEERLRKGRLASGRGWDHCPPSTIGDPAYLTQFGRINSS